MTLDLKTIKSGQQQAWKTGDYQLVANALNLSSMSEALCASVPVLPHHQVLDVATGTGNTALAAKRRGFPHVTACDYSPELLEIGRKRATAEHLMISFDEGDAEDLPYSSDSFDVVVSTVGVSFAPNQQRAASELVRVCRPGGKVAWTMWASDGDISEFNKTIFEYVPPPSELPSPLRWATREGIRELFEDRIDAVSHERELAVPVKSPEDAVDMLLSNFGPAMIARSKLDADRQVQLRNDLVSVFASRCRWVDGAAVLPGNYLEVVATVR